MLIHPDFSRPALLKAEDHQWVSSPQPGVERVMLDRLGEEKARATSLVRYAPGSVFPAHGHPGGEEILVLSGTFTDDSGDHGAGWYLRNPPGSSHQPSSAEGALIFVKLWQMAPDDQHTVRIDTRDPAAWRHDESGAVCPLFDSESEQVCLRRYPDGAAVKLDMHGGAELLVTQGTLWAAGERLLRGGWLRWPPNVPCALSAGEGGVTIYLKTGHLSALTV